MVIDLLSIASARNASRAADELLLRRVREAAASVPPMRLSARFFVLLRRLEDDVAKGVAQDVLDRVRAFICKESCRGMGLDECLAFAARLRLETPRMSYACEPIPDEFQDRMCSSSWMTLTLRSSPTGGTVPPPPEELRSHPLWGIACEQTDHLSDVLVAGLRVEIDEFLPRHLRKRTGSEYYGKLSEVVASAVQ